MQTIDFLLDTAREFLHQISALLPRLALAFVVVLAGWLFAKAARFAVERALRAVNFHVLTERAGTDHFLQQGGLRGDTTTLFGLFAYWVVILAALIMASNGVGLAYIPDLLQRVVLFAPKVLVSMLVVVFGSYFARFVGSAVAAYCHRSPDSGRGLAGKDRAIPHHGLRHHDRAQPGGGGRRHRSTNISRDPGGRRAGAGAGIRPRRQGMGGGPSRALVAAASTQGRPLSR